MSTIMPQSELARKALAWICEEREKPGAKPLAQIVDQAAMRFNLGPKDVEFLARLLAEQEEK
ncbi:MAG: hypothetical protein AB7D51_10870 [Desulfovibrionaceae bacterium]|jgi:hypothetical protein